MGACGYSSQFKEVYCLQTGVYKQENAWKRYCRREYERLYGRMRHFKAKRDFIPEKGKKKRQIQSRIKITFDPASLSF